jgi:guanylate kinase
MGVYIFLLPPSREVLAARLKSRATDAPEEIDTRLKWSEREISMAKRYDYLVINDDVHRAVDTVKAIITAERCRPYLYNLEETWFAR